MSSLSVEKHDMTIENIRLFCEQFPGNGMSITWSQMLEDLDIDDDDDLDDDDFIEELEYQEYDGNLSRRDISQIYNFFESEDD